MGWVPDHGRIKERYRPIPNAAEARHEARLRETPCFGCGRNCECTHHTLLHFDEKRFRRDHRCQLPLCNACHRALHANGNEADWLESIGRTDAEAIAFMVQAWAESDLLEQYEGRKYG